MIRNVAEEVNDKINTLRNARYPHPQTLDEVKDVITSGMREMQLTAVSLCTFQIASYQDEHTYVDLDDTDLLTDALIAFPQEFSEHMEELQAAAQEGELLGTADFLETLVPPDITNPDMRIIYYSPWKRSLLQRKGILRDNIDGSATAVLKTALPNIGVYYDYQPGDDFPARTIGLLYT